MVKKKKVVRLIQQPQRMETFNFGRTVAYPFSKKIQEQERIKSEARKGNIEEAPQESYLRKSYQKGRKLRGRDEQPMGKVGTFFESLGSQPNIRIKKKRVGKARRQWGSVPNLYRAGGRLY